MSNSLHLRVRRYPYSPLLPCSVAIRTRQLARLIQFLSMFVSGFMIGFIKGWELALVRGRPLPHQTRNVVPVSLV